MPYRLSWEPEGVVLVASAVFTDDDLDSANAEIYASHRFESLKYQIADFSRIEKLALSYDAAVRAARNDHLAAARNPTVRVAIVTNDAFVVGMTSVYRNSHEAAGGPWSTRSFNSIEEARRWVEPAVLMGQTGDDKRSSGDDPPGD